MEILHVKVIAMPFLPIPPYTNSANPISNITPFTYGDGYTYLSLLEDMRVYLNTMIDSVNANTDSANDVVEQFTELVNHVNDAIADYGTQLDNWSDDFDVNFKATFDKLRADALTLVLTTTQNGAIFNPTRGFYDPIGDVVIGVYDFLRTFSYTAAEYDALELTQDDYDNQFVDAYAYDVRTAQSAITEEIQTLVSQATQASNDANAAAQNATNTANQAAINATNAINQMTGLLTNATILMDQRGDVAGTIDLTNLTKQSFIHCRLVGNTKVTLPANPTVGMCVNFEVLQNATGGYTFTFNTTVTSYGITSVISSTANSLSEVICMWDGVRWKARVAGTNDAIPVGWNV